MKLLGRILKHHVSDEDYFIHRFDFEHSGQLSSSQQREMAKHDRIALLRDQVVSKKDDDKLWENF